MNMPNDFQQVAPMAGQGNFSGTTLREEAVLKKSYGHGMMGSLMYYIFSTVFASYLIFGLIFLFSALIGYKSGGNITASASQEIYKIMTEMTDLSKPYTYIISLASYISAGALCLLLYYKQNIKEFAGFFKRPVASSGGHVIMWSVLVLGVSQASSILCYWISYGLKVDKASEINGVLSLGNGNLLTDITLALYVAIAAPVLEEIIFRGLLLKPVSQVSRGFGIVVSAIAFGLMHGNIVQSLNGFFLGVVLAVAAIRTGSLKMPIIMHVCVNTNALLQNYLAKTDAVLAVNIITWAFMLGALVLAIIFRHEIFGLLKPVKVALPMPEMPMQNMQHMANPEGTAGQGYGPQVQPQPMPMPVYVNPAKGRCWKILLKLPSFWVFVVLMLGVMVYSYFAALMVSSLR